MEAVSECKESSLCCRGFFRFGKKHGLLFSEKNMNDKKTPGSNLKSVAFRF